MKVFSILFAAILALSLTLNSGDSEAASRLGGGKSVGMQRQASAPPAGAPAQSAAPMANKNPAAAAPAQAQPKRSWMGPLAGLAAGLGLAALASHFGFGEGLANMMMIGLLVMGAVMVIGYFMRKKAASQQPAYAGAGDVHAYNTNNQTYDVTPTPVAIGSDVTSAAQSNIPADFDVAGFTRHAKVNFIRLQAANDTKNLSDIREFTTPEMLAEVQLSFAERGTEAQTTDVVTIEANVLEIAEEADRYIASVRFTGLIREAKESAAEPIDEIWHLVKARQGQSGWLLAGIQQTQ